MSTSSIYMCTICTVCTICVCIPHVPCVQSWYMCTWYNMYDDASRIYYIHIILYIYDESDASYSCSTCVPHLILTSNCNCNSAVTSKIHSSRVKTATIPGTELEQEKRERSLSVITGESCPACNRLEVSGRPREQRQTNYLCLS